jgi:hypothetical protein
MTTLATLQEIEHAIDNVPLFPQRFFNVISCIVTWSLFLFIAHWREHQKDFSFNKWWSEDRGRIIAASVVTIALVILKATSRDIDTLLEFLGFRVSNTSGIAYGMAIAAFLGLKQKKNNGNGKPPDR